MVSALDSGSDVPGSSPGRGTALCSFFFFFFPSDSFINSITQLTMLTIQYY